MTLSVGQVLGRALIAGLLAALLVALFHFVTTEPIVEQAISLETQRHIADGTYEEPLLTRDVQRLGLFVGFLLYGTTWALLFTAVYALTQRWLPGGTPAARGAWLAGLGFWALALVPFLRYPASPPGVGDPDTIEMRQGLYLTVLLAGILGAAIAVALDRQLLRRMAGVTQRLAGCGGLLLLWTVAIILAFPSSADVSATPTELIQRFRILSLVGLAVFWVVLGTTFGLQAWWTTRQRGRRRARSPLAARS